MSLWKLTQPQRKQRLNVWRIVLTGLAGLSLLSALAGQTSSLAAPQATAIPASRAAVVRPGGADLYAKPDGERQTTLTAGTIVTALGRTADSRWVMVQTQEGAAGWTSGDTLIVPDLAGLPVIVEPAGSSEVAGAASPAPPVPAATVAMPTVTPTPHATATPQVTPTEVTAPLAVATPYPASASGDTGQLAIARATGALLLDAPDGAPLHQLEPGALVLLFARTADNGWVQAQRAHDPAQNGWIATSQLYLSNLAALPAMGVAAPAAGNEGAAASEANTPATESIARRLQVTVASDGDRLNIRSGPGISYPVIAKALDEESYTALGRNAKGDWLQIDTTAGNAALYEVAAGWVAVEFVTTTGQIDTLPVVEPQAPPPTRTPSPGGNLAGSSLNNVSISAAGARPVSGLTGVLVFQTSPGGMIYGYDLATGATWPLTNGFDPAISPDGGTVAFVRDGGESGLYLIDIDGSNERRIYAGAARLSSPKWSPDGHWIVFTRGNEFIECRQVGLSCVEEGSLPPGFEIDDEEMPLVRQYSYVLSRVDRNGENYRDIPSLASARAADWNEAGIVYQSDAGLQITTDTPDAENRLVIFDFLKPHFADPDWQPNSGRIAYMGREASHHEIFALNPDGSGATALTRPATTLVDEIPANVAPAWSPDGQHIVFLSNRAEGGEAGDWRIWVMEADGSNPRPLPIDIPITYTYGGEQAVDWGPAAR